MPEQVDSQWLTPAQAAVILQVPRNHVYRLIATGVLPARRIGHYWRIVPSDLEKVGVVDRPTRSQALPMIEPSPPPAVPTQRRRSAQPVRTVRARDLYPELRQVPQTGD